MFKKAKPVFPVGKAVEKNVFAAFRATVEDIEDAELFVTAASFYQVWVNGEFVAFGPARTAKGYARVDVISFDGCSKKSENEIVILVVSHFCGALSAVKQPGFLWAELRRGDGVIAATGYDFDAYLPDRKVQAVERYSIQRHFSEVWDYKICPGLFDEKYRCGTEELLPAPQPIPRVAPYPYYGDIPIDFAVSGGVLAEPDSSASPLPRTTYETQDNEWGKFEIDVIKHFPYEWLRTRRQIKREGKAALPLSLRENEYAVFDFSRIETGFIRMLAAASEDSEIIIGFSEDGSADRFEFSSPSICNVIQIIAGKGQSVNFLSFEPYVGRYFIVAVRSGAVTLEGFGIKSFEHTVDGVLPEEPKDPELAAIFRAAVRTFAHNSVDIYMDCPSRERAGWLCDSYFSGKTEYVMFRNTEVEDAFLENFRLYRNEGEYPTGSLPMCYPSEPLDGGTFIPQWTMWYILEAEDYVNRRGHKAEAELFRSSIDGLLGFYGEYENSDGLLEDLPSWNFVEWSAANSWTKNVNYPTNFLYAATLEACYRLYGDESLLCRSNRIREKVIAQSFDGTRFYDHAVRNGEGKLELQRDCSEIAQYYAILFGGFDINGEKYAALRRLIIEDCIADSPDYPKDMEPINAFIGVYLRLEALLGMKEYDLVISDIRSFFGGMAKDTQTLWENRQRRGSRDHGFASYALVAMLRALIRN